MLNRLQIQPLKAKQKMFKFSIVCFYQRATTKREPGNPGTWKMLLSSEKAGWGNRNELVMTKDNKRAAAEMRSPGLSAQFLSSKALEVSALKLSISNCI